MVPSVVQRLLAVVLLPLSPRQVGSGGRMEGETGGAAAARGREARRLVFSVPSLRFLTVGRPFSLCFAKPASAQCA